MSAQQWEGLDYDANSPDGARLVAVIDGAPDAFVAMDQDGTVTSWNVAAEELFGWSRAEAVGEPLRTLIVPPELRAAHAAGLARFMETGKPRVVGHRLELTARHRDGHDVPVEFTISALKTPAGWAFHAFMHDNSERKAAERQAELLALVVAASPDAICATDRDGRILSWNPAAERTYGYTEAEMLGRHVALLGLPGSLDRFDEIHQTVVEQEAVYKREVRRRHKDGHAVDVLLTVTPMRDAAGLVVGRSAIARDITARRRNEEQLATYVRELRARTAEDPGTGLPTRRGLLDALAARIARGTPFALLLIGFDGFHRPGSRTQHLATQEALRRLAAAAVQEVGDSSEVFRHTGSTFATLVDPGEAETVGRQLRHALAHVAPRLRISDGMATWCPELDREALLDVAQTSLDRRRIDDPTPAGGQPVVVDLAPGALGPEAARSIDGMLHAASRHLGMDVAWLSEFSGTRQVFRSVGGDPAALGLSAGQEFDLAGTFCVRVLDGRLPAAIPDTAANPMAAALDTGLGAYVGAPVRLADGRLFGMLCAAARDARPELADRHAKALRLLATLVAQRLDEEALAADHRRAALEDTGIVALLAALAERDRYTGAHSHAVVALAGGVARGLGLAPGVVEEIEQVALVHDVGKVGIPDAVLLKEGPLDALEWELMRQHSALGAAIVASIGALSHLAPAVRGEHERWDGRGYPDGLARADIPQASRIVLAADAFHAMTSDRPYRTALDLDEAVAELRANAGTQFDPAVVDALVSVVTTG